MISPIPDVVASPGMLPPTHTHASASAGSSSGFSAVLRSVHPGAATSLDETFVEDSTPGPVAPRARAGSQSAESTDPGQPSTPTPPRARTGSEPPATEYPGPSIHPPGFIRSDDIEGPLRFQEVPADAQWPAGPFVQAPEEYGGEWWKRSPFTGPEPWLALDRPFIKPEEVLPEGFVELFGPRPNYKDFDNYFEYQVANVGWEDTLGRFEGIGMPEGIDAEELNAAVEVMREWGLGDPVFYEDVNGWHAKFPDSGNPDFEINPTTLLMAPHVTVARYQLGLIRLGIIPAELHPFIPPTVRERLSEAVVA